MGSRRDRPAKILILSIGYKKNVDDMRESPALKLIELLKARGAEVTFHDPFVPEIPLTREHPEFTGMRSVDLSDKVLQDADAVLIAPTRRRWTTISWFAAPASWSTRATPRVPSRTAASSLTPVQSLMDRGRTLFLYLGAPRRPLRLHA